MPLYRVLAPGRQILRPGQTPFWTRGSREVVSPSGAHRLALPSSNDLARRPCCPFVLSRSPCPQRLAPKNITLGESPGTRSQNFLNGRRHYLET